MWVCTWQFHRRSNLRLVCQSPHQIWNLQVRESTKLGSKCGSWSYPVLNAWEKMRWTFHWLITPRTGSVLGLAVISYISKYGNYILQSIHPSINQYQNFCSNKVRRPVGPIRQNIWNGGFLGKPGIKFTQLFILGPSFFPRPSHNTISPPNFKSNMHVCVFSKKYPLGPNCQNEKEQLWKREMRTRRHRKR